MPATGGVTLTPPHTHRVWRRRQVRRHWRAELARPPAAERCPPIVAAIKPPLMAEQRHRCPWAAPPRGGGRHNLRLCRRLTKLIGPPPRSGATRSSGAPSLGRPGGTAEGWPPQCDSIDRRHIVLTPGVRTILGGQCDKVALWRHSLWRHKRRRRLMPPIRLGRPAERAAGGR